MMNPKIYKLRTFRRVFPDAEKMIQQFISKDPERDEFLKEKADHFAKYGKGQTFIAVDDNEIVGFFSFSVYGVQKKDFKLTSKMRNRMSQYTGDDDMRYNVVTLIGQFAKKEGTPLPGSILLSLALDIITEACDDLAILYIIVQCKKEQKLLEFYQNNGFVKYSETDDLYNLSYDIQEHMKDDDV